MDSEIIQNQKLIIRIEFNNIKFKHVVDNKSIKIDDLKKQIFEKLKTMIPDNLIPELYMITDESNFELSPSDNLCDLVQNNEILKIIKKKKLKQELEQQQQLQEFEQQQEEQEQQKEEQEQQQEEQEQQQQENQDLQIQADPQEAIVVLIDCSGSMENLYSNDNLITRKEAVNILFSVFLEKMIGYKINNVMQLICFSNIIEQKSDFTKDLSNFQNLLGDLKLMIWNRLFDATKQAVDNLCILRQQKYPNIKLRIIVFTGGDDNSSLFKPENLKNLIIQNNIVLDSFVLGENCTILKNMSHASGGLCFNPSTLEKGLQLFDVESILSITLCHKFCKPKVDRKVDLHNLNTPFDTEDLEAMRPDDLQKPAISVQQMINNIQNDEILYDQCQTQQTIQRRIFKELQDIKKNPIKEFKVTLAENDMFFWNITIFGPEKSPYAGGIFKLFAIIPTNYPFKPPKVNFITKIYHCNITKNGSICMDILQDNEWTPALTISNVILSIISLLTDPNPNDPIENEIAQIYKQDKSKYEQIAQEWTKKYAI